MGRPQASNNMGAGILEEPEEFNCARLDEYLTPIEFGYLEQIRDGAKLRDPLSNPHCERLIELGYAQEVLGSITLPMLAECDWHNADRRLIGPLRRVPVPPAPVPVQRLHHHDARRHQVTAVCPDQH